jgi:predicted Zn-dependent protease
MGQGSDPRDRELVAGIARHLAAVVENKLRQFHVEVVQTEGPGAMALPGGFIFVGASLLDLCERQPEELAFVIGHEMAHVIQGHAFQRIVRSMGMEVISFLLSRGTLTPWLRQSGLKLLQSAHSHDAELEADALGVRLAKAAGYDPRGSLRLLQRLETLRQTSEGIGDYFAAHPPEAVRIAHLIKGRSETE